MSLITDDDVRRILSKVPDPEVGVDIVDLGLVYKIEVSGTNVFIEMTMTTPACPLASYIKQTIDEELRMAFPKLDKIKVNVVYDPPWEPEKMSDSAKKFLGWT